MDVLATLGPWQQEFEQAIVYRYEGLSPYLYLDTVGLVTVGRGCQVSLAEAQTLPFQVDGRAATLDEIRSEYQRIVALPRAHKVAFYTSSTSPRLLPIDIERLVQKRIISATALLASLFPAFATWPNPAKIATLEMPWGLGEYKFRTTYPHLRAALLAQDWQTAAKECAWADPTNIYLERNAARVGRYMEAAKGGT